MIEQVELVDHILALFAKGEIAELDIVLDVPDQTISVTMRRDPLVSSHSRPSGAGSILPCSSSGGLS